MPSQKDRLAKHSLPIVFFLLLVGLLGWFVQSNRRHSAAQDKETTAATMRAQVSESYGNLPLSFEINQGQAEPAIKFLSRAGGYELRLSASAAVLHLPNSVPLRVQFVGANPEPEIEGSKELPGKSNYFIGCSPQQWRTGLANYARVRYRNIYPGIDLAFYGNRRELEYDFIVAPGADPQLIKLSFAGAQRLWLDSSGDLVLQTASGDELRQRRPVVYQEEDGQRRSVTGRYELLGEREVAFALGPYETSQPLVIDPVLSYAAQGIGGTLIAVDAAGNAYLGGATTGGVLLVNPLQEKDQKQSIWADAYVAKLNAAGTALLYSTYIGGNASDVAHSLAVDATGNVTLVGETTSTDFTGTEFSPFFKSNDGGSSWSNRNTGLDKKFDLYSVVVDPANPQTLYAVNGNFNLDTRAGKAVKSTDGGKTWVVSETGLSAGASTLALDPRRPATLYAGTVGGVFKTINGGGNWNQVWRTRGAVRNLVVNPGNTDVVYACLRWDGSEMNEAGVYRSPDGGNTWQMTLRINNPDSITIDPTNPATVYVVDTGDTLYRSRDGGVNWNVAARLDFTISRGALVVDPANPLTLYAGAGGGLRKSIDGGVTWRRLGPETNIFALAIDRANPQTLYIGAGAIGFLTSFPGGVFRSLDGGETWQQTSVTNFPLSLALDPTDSRNVYAGVGPRSNPDAFVTRLNADGSQVIYSKVFGGSFTESATGVAVGANGAAYVIGHTDSPDFPTTSNAFQPKISGDSVHGDFFVLKLNAAGAVDYATLFGGSGVEKGLDEESRKPQIALAAAEQVYVTGTTSSTDFPLKQPLQASYGGGDSDAFVAKFDLARAGADSLIYSTYLGGNQSEIGLAIGADALGQACVLLAGRLGDLPTSPDSFRREPARLGYLAKLRADGAGLVYATYLGLLATGLAVDRAGNIYLTGREGEQTLPVVPGELSQRPGNTYAMKLNATASALEYATLLPGELAFGIAVDPVGNAYVTGYAQTEIATTPGAFRHSGYPWFTAKLAASTRSTALVSVSAASFSGGTLARGSISTAFGLGLAEQTRVATDSLPDSLADVELVLKDSAGAERRAPLFFVSPTQLNYQLPPEAALGPATVSLVFNGKRLTTSGTVHSSVRVAQGITEIARVAPGLFSANADGRGVAAAVVQRVRNDGLLTYEAVARFDPVQGRFIAVPIELGTEDEQLFLILFGTGFRQLVSPETVRVQIGGVAVPVLYAGGQPNLIGLDQLNVQLPRSLAGRGEVELTVTIDGLTANPVRVNIK